MPSIPIKDLVDQLDPEETFSFYSRHLNAVLHFKEAKDRVHVVYTGVGDISEYNIKKPIIIKHVMDVCLSHKGRALCLDLNDEAFIERLRNEVMMKVKEGQRTIDLEIKSKTVPVLNPEVRNYPAQALLWAQGVDSVF